MSKAFLSSVKRVSKNVKGLVTSYEAAATPALPKTMKTDKSTRLPTEYSQRTYANREDEDEDGFLNSDEFSHIFIDPQEEKKIQDLLEFARLGKINPNNAFDIPLTVLDPDTTETGGLRFWKFASELLGASICIYDKRVEGMFQLVNKAFTTFVRTTSSQASEDHEETAYSRSKRKKGEAMTAEMTGLRENPNVSLLEVAKMNLEDPSRISTKVGLLQNQSSVLFQKTLQAFDSNTLRSLFLNIFELGKSMQVSFFCDNVQVKIEYEKLEAKEMEEEGQEFPSFLSEELRKLDFVGKNSQCYTYISEYIAENRLKDESEARLDFSMEFKDLKSKQFDMTRHSTHEEPPTQFSGRFSDDMTQDKFSFHYVSQLDHEISLSESLNHSERSIDSRFPASEQRSKDFMVIEEDEFSVLTPRELEFKGLKLLKKRANALKDQLIVRRKRNSNIETFSFSSQQTQQDECRSQILKMCKPSEPIRIRPYEDKFLVAKSMDPFIEIHRRRKREREAFSRPHPSERKQSQTKVGDGIMADEQEVDAMDARNEQTTLNSNQYAESSLAGSFCMEEQMSTEGIANLKTYGLRSIRQIKQSLAERLQKEEQLILSKLRLPVSPASAFIILLHLVNQHGLQVRAIDGERDLAISMAQIGQK